MSRLIDAETYEQSLIENGWDKEVDGCSDDGVFELLHDVPTVQTIPLDKVKQARENVQKYVNVCDEDTVAGRNMKSGLAIALEEIDKLIESEEK